MKKHSVHRGAEDAHTCVCVLIGKNMLRMLITEWKVRVVFTVILSFLTMSKYCLQHKNKTAPGVSYVVEK